MNPKIYLVGGAVRDIMMGREPKDHDYVVVGANHEWMISQGFRQIGLSFPVYIHPVSGYEYALARREKKTGEGYNGFSVDTADVTIEEDLKRRDLTMNSMALDDQMNLIDPYNGMSDIRDGVLRHTSDAFSEDPIRVLRMARFAGRYKFDASYGAVRKSSEIVHELDSVDKNRVWLELRRGLAEPHIKSFMDTLHWIEATRSKLMASILQEYNEYDLQVHHQIYANCCDSDVLVATYLTPSKENGASVMSIDLYQMKIAYRELRSTDERIEFILKWRLHKDCTRTENFFKMIVGLHPDCIADFRSMIDRIKNSKLSSDDIEAMKSMSSSEIKKYVRSFYANLFEGSTTEFASPYVLE